MRVGIAGVGFMGSTHAAAWAETEAEMLAGVLDDFLDAVTAGWEKRWDKKIEDKNMLVWRQDTL